MNETQARNAMMVRAYELAPAEHARPYWSDEDRDWATRAARQAEGEHASADAFIARRAALACERLRSRDRTAARALRAIAWNRWFGGVVVLAALATGIAADAIGAAGRINLLSPPLLALIAWNLVAYVLLASRAVLALAGARGAGAGVLAHLVARAAHAFAPLSKFSRRSIVVSTFVADWLAASAPLTAARVGIVMHLSAAAFAAGAISGMYLRGLGLAYLAGWESTFLQPDAVHAILDTLLAPASWLTRIAVPDAAQLGSIRFDVSPGESAARWIHLYAATLALAVLLPRLSLAALHGWRARRLAARFPLPLEQAYFVALANAHLGLQTRARIVPYSYRLAAQAEKGLDALIGQVFGARAHASIASPVEFGAEDALDARIVGDAAPALVAALFPSTATPESETHGAFVDALARLVPDGTAFLVLVDESPFHERFGRAPDALVRRDERRGAWTRMLAELDRVPVFVDPCAPDPEAGVRALESAIDRDAGASPTLAARRESK